MSELALVEIVIGGLAVVAAVVGWLVRGVIVHGTEIAALKETLKTLPTRDSWHEVAVGLAKVTGGIDVLNERTQGIARILDRHERYLDEERRRAG